MEERTLCKRCAENYREAGFRLILKEFQFICEPCDLCGKKGVEYGVLKKGGGSIEHS